MRYFHFVRAKMHFLLNFATATMKPQPVVGVGKNLDTAETACSLPPKSKDDVVPEPEAEETHDGAEAHGDETPKPGGEKFDNASSPSENCEQAVAQAPSQTDE